MLRIVVSLFVQNNNKKTYTKDYLIKVKGSDMILYKKNAPNYKGKEVKI